MVTLLIYLHIEYIMRNARLDEAQAGIKIARRNTNNLRYADDTTLMAEIDQELERLLTQVKGVCQGCIVSPCLCNLYAEYNMRNAGLEKAQAGIKTAGRNINNLRYADDTPLLWQKMKGNEKASWLLESSPHRIQGNLKEKRHQWMI